MLTHENEARKKGFRFIVGVDEAGRGPLAGPVVAAAVSLKAHAFKSKIDDSKKLSPQQRKEAFYEIFEHAYVGIGIINEVVIDDVNILRASHLAMTSAVRQMIGQLEKSKENLNTAAGCILLLIDGNSFSSDLPYAYKTIVNGDALSYSIACASIVAKVYRDRLLETYDRIWPQYGFKKHKGYPTLEHRRAIEQHGPSPIQRKTFQVKF